LGFDLILAGTRIEAESITGKQTRERFI